MEVPYFEKLNQIKCNNIGFGTFFAIDKQRKKT